MGLRFARNTDETRARILLVEDHEVVRSRLKSLIDFEDDLVVVGEAGTAEEGIRRVESDLPQLVLMDVRLPDRSGIEACWEITSRHPGVRVLILTSYADDAALSSAIASRASGYVLKKASGVELIVTVRRVLDGEVVFEHGWDSPRHDSPLAGLSPQERFIAGHLAEGLTNHESADRMGLADKTVENYVSNTLAKIGVSRHSAVPALVARAEATSASREMALVCQR